MKFSILSMTAVAAVFLATSTAQAGVVSSATLSSSAGHYTNIDGSGLNLDVTTMADGSLSTIGGGLYQGLWFGGNNGDALYTLTFSKAITYVSIEVNAMSTSSSYFETISQFALNAPGTPVFTFTNIASTAWDGSTITSSAPDGYFRMGLTAAGGAAFNTVSFFHNQDGAPNGSVFKAIAFQGSEVVIGDGGTGGGVPEPATWALMFTGFGMAGVALRRRTALSRTV